MRRAHRGLELVVYTDSAVIGGSETSAARLIHALSPSVNVTVVGMESHVVDWIAAHRSGAPAVTLPPPRRRGDPRTLAAHVRTLRRLQPAILQLNLITPWSCRYAVAATALAGVRRVVAVAHSPQTTDSRTYKRYLSRAAKRFDAVVSVGDKTAREVESIFALAPGSVRTIYNGVDDVALHEQVRPSAGPVVGSLARLDEHKGFDILLEALASLPDAAALLVGEGTERSRLLELARDLGIAERLTLTGWQNDARSFLTAMDVYAAPSRLEGLPLGVCEAMLAGLPVVASDVGSLSEAIVDGETGFLIPPEQPDALAEALRKVCTDAGLRGRFGANARARALNLFSMPAMAHRYESLYEEIAA